MRKRKRERVSGHLLHKGVEKKNYTIKKVIKSTLLSILRKVIHPYLVHTQIANEIIVKNPKRICIISSYGGFGDTVFELYMIPFIKQHFPDCKIDVIVRHTSKFLYENNPDIENIYPMEMSHANIIRSMLKNNLDIPLQDTDLILNRSSDETAVKADFIGRHFQSESTPYIKIPVINNDFEGARSTSDKLTDYIGSLLGVTLSGESGQESHSPVLFLSDSQKNFIGKREEEHEIQKTDTIITICIGSTDPRRNYPYWLNLCHLIHDTYPDAKILLSGDNNSIGIFENIFTSLESPEWLLQGAGKTSLKEAIALLDRSNLVIAADSGPGNMSMGLGTPTIMIYSWIPPGSRVPTSAEGHTLGIHTGCEGCTTLECSSVKNLEKVCEGSPQLYCKKCMPTVPPEKIMEKISQLMTEKK